MPVLATKVANALIEDAEFAPNPAVKRVMDIADAQGIDTVLEQFKRHFGGLWVGGRLTLTDTALTFAPNGMNRAVHKDLATVTIPLAAITGVEVLPGVLTKIIAIRTGSHIFKTRCWGARPFAAKITATLPA